MIGNSYRKWRPVVGVLAVGMLAFGLSLQGAPAGEGSAAGSADRVHKKVDTQTGVAKQAVLPGLEAQAPSMRTSLGDAGTRPRAKRALIPYAVAMTAVQPIARVATRDAAAIQTPCTCDLDCAGLDANDGCTLGHCIEGECEVRDAPTYTRCEDGVNYCTIGLCDDPQREVHGDAECVDHATVDPTGTTYPEPSLSRCAKECDGGANDGQSCTIEFHCAGGNGCTLKTHRAPTEPGWNVTCAEVGGSYDCTLTHDAADVVRCCETVDLADIGYKSSAACDTDGGIGMEITDPDDTMHVTGSNPRCPQYSSGIAPTDAGAFDGSAVGPVTPPAKMCNNLGLLEAGEYGGPCEIAADCHTRCADGVNQGEICQPANEAIDCPESTCVADTCVANADDCPGMVSLGDDYSFNTNKWIRLQEIRFRGGTGRKDEVISFDIYDAQTPPVRVTSIAQRFQESGTATYRIIADCGEGCDFWQELCDIQDLRCEIPDDPPRVIPPKGWLVMRANRNVPVTQDGFLIYHNFDLNGHWVPTDVVDVGGNDAGRIWVDGVIYESTDASPAEHSTVPGNGDRVLAFELVGVELDEDPMGGCCRPESQGGGCVDTYEHKCRFCLGSAGTHLGDVCDRGMSRNEGTWAEIDRDCPGMLEGCSTNLWHGMRSIEDYLVDSPEDCTTACSEGSCCDTDGSCTVVGSAGECSGTFLGLGTSCSDDAPSEPPPGAWEPNCCEQPAVPRDPGGGCCEDLYQCQSGEWCNPLDSHSCDAPATGPCELVCPGAEVLELVVPPLLPPGQRTVLNITTDSTGTEPEGGLDDCRHGTDPGWFVAWHLDDCANVTLNFCCNEPVFVPAGVVIPFDVCPCDQPGSQLAANPNRYGYGAAARNNFWCEDGNLSIEWTLGPGTYHYEPNTSSQCEGTADDCQSEAQCVPGVACIDHRQKLQLHIIAEPCQPAACCLIDEQPADPTATCASSRCEYLNVWECTVAQGDFLGNLEQPVPDCSVEPPPCDRGSCCVVGGECDDGEPPGTKVTCPDCKAQNAAFPYHGGLTCEDAPCNVCAFEDAAHGQGASGEYIFTGDLNFGVRVADDFTPAETGVIERVCYNHAYVPPQGGECSDTPADDQLEIRFYEDDFGVPGAELEDSPGAAAQWDSRGGQAGYRTWRYSAPIVPGVMVDVGECYWISIQGRGRPDCTLFWTESRDGNNYRVRDDDGIWGPEDLRDSDYSWWVDIGIVPAINPWVDGGCGDIQVACCRSDGSCEEGLISDCLADNGIYYPISGDENAPLHSCDDEGFECPVPAGNDCADAVPLCQNVCTHPTNNLLSSRWSCETDDDCVDPDTCEPWAPDPDNGYCTNADLLDDGPVCSLSARDCYDASPCRPYPDGAEVYRCFANKDNRLATTDGPSAAGGCFASGENSFQADVWHKITAPCTGILVVDECRSQLTYDGMLAVFGDGSSDYADTACPITTNDDLIMCNDDFCPGSATVSGVQAATAKDAVYMLRTGGWAAGGTQVTASQGRSTMNIGMICPELPDVFSPGLPPNALHQDTKNRVVSLDLSTNLLTEVAYKLTLSEMNRCSGDDRRACTATDPCPNICSGNSDLQCTDDGQCGGAAPCIPSGPCVAHADVGTSWYIGEPYTKAAFPNNDLVGESLANVVAAPVFRVWPEDTVHVLGCEIVPVAVYEWVAVNREDVESDPPFTKGTIVKPLGTHYGDVVGIVTGGAFTPPQGVVSVTDVSAYLIANQGGAPGTTPPHTTWVDLHGTEFTEPCAGDNCTIPQAILGVSDLGRIKFGFLGMTYNETPGQEDPGNCPP